MQDSDSNKIKKSKENKTVIEITVIGEDKKGVVAEITNFIFKNKGNIEKINQNVVKICLECNWKHHLVV